MYSKIYQEVQILVRATLRNVEDNNGSTYLMCKKFPIYFGSCEEPAREKTGSVRIGKENYPKFGYRDIDILASFTTEQGLVDVLFDLGVGENEHDRIVKDEFFSMEVKVGQYENNPEGIQKHMKDLNKAFSSSVDARIRLYFPPLVTSRFVGLVHYTEVCYFRFHTILDM